VTTRCLHALADARIDPGRTSFRQDRSKTRDEGATRTHHGAAGRFGEVALRTRWVEMQRWLSAVATAVMDDTIATEANNEMRTCGKPVEPSIAGQLVDKVLGCSFPRQAPAERNSLSAQILGIDYND
jgi:hypothetical protein